jgi:hypothetical protein
LARLKVDEAQDVGVGVVLDQPEGVADDFRTVEVQTVGALMVLNQHAPGGEIVGV